MDALELQKRFPSAYMAGVKVYLRRETMPANPYLTPCSPTIRTEWHAWESGYESMLPLDRREDG